MTQAYYSAIIDHPVETVWSLIRDFNNYPAYIDGVTESVIEDGKGGDEVGAIRRFCYLGNWVRQSLTEHSDERRMLTYQSLEPFPFPSGVHPGQVSPTGYRGTMHLLGVTEGDRTFIEWSVRLSPEPQDADSWLVLFQSWIPEWTNSLARALTRRAKDSARESSSSLSLASTWAAPPKPFHWDQVGGVARMTSQQTFADPDAGTWLKIDFLPGVELLPLAQPVPDGSIHRARLAAGTVIPVHTHPADEFVLVLSGTVETGGRRCEVGTFWTTPAQTRQGPHVAITDVELLTVRLGAMGTFGDGK